jgi:type IV secretory pathway protease TraF
MGVQHRNFVLAMSAVAVAAMVMKPLFDPVPLVIWNASNSVPIGWYFVAKRQPNLTEIAVIRLPEWVEIYASARGYLPLHTPLLKYLDTKHRMLPVWKGCRRLKSNEIFVLGMHRDSFDSRYFGMISRTQVVGTAVHAADLFK